MTLYLRAADYSIERSWDLVDWCRSHGADEFFLRLMSTVGLPEPAVEDAERRLAPFARPQSVRERAVKYLKDQELMETPLWALTAESVPILKELLADGLFTHPSYARDGWFEEPTLYRRGELLLGIVSHEDEGFLRVSAEESADLRRNGFPTHEVGEYVRDSLPTA